MDGPMHSIHILKVLKRDMYRGAIKFVLAGTVNSLHLYHGGSDAAITSLAQHNQFITQAHLQIPGQKLSHQCLIGIAF